MNLDRAEGWIELVNFCDENPAYIAVVNSPARSNTGMEKYGATLKETLSELQRELTAFWIINRQRDSIELLRAFLDVFPEALVHVCRNLYFGEPDASRRVPQRSEPRGRSIFRRSGRQRVRWETIKGDHQTASAGLGFSGARAASFLALPYEIRKPNKVPRLRLFYGLGTSTYSLSYHAYKA